MNDTGAEDWPRDIFEALEAEDVCQVAYVPDSGISRLITLCRDDPAMTAAAEALAARLVEGEVELVARFSALLFDSPLVIVGSGLKLGRALAAAELPGTPENVSGRGEARVWTTRAARGFPVIVIETDSVAALEAVTRKLPHYGAKSFLVFDGGEVATSGIWPPGAKPLRIEFP